MAEIVIRTDTDFNRITMGYCVGGIDRILWMSWAEKGGWDFAWARGSWDRMLPSGHPWHVIRSNAAD